MNANRAAADKHIRKLALIRCSMNIRKTLAIVALAEQPRRLRRGRPDFEGAFVFEGGRGRPRARHRREAGSRLQLAQWQSAVGDGDVSEGYVGKPLDELAGTVREVVAKEFKQTPDTIVLGFALDK